MFSLPGVPMLYYGQESGVTSTWPTIGTNRTIRSYDRHDLWPFYQHLIEHRSELPALHGRSFEEVPFVSENPSGQALAFRRWHEGQNVLAVVNLGANSASLVAALPEGELEFDFDTSGDIFLTDLLTGDFITTDRRGLAGIHLDLPGHDAAIYVIADSVLSVSVSSEPAMASLAEEFVLHPNYPNPFSDQTYLVMEVPSMTQVRYSVFDLLGRQVLSDESGPLSRGRHEIPLTTAALASGVYVLRVDAAGVSQSRLITLVR